MIDYRLVFNLRIGNDLRIFKTRFKYDLRNFDFTKRVLDAWNRPSLPNYIAAANNTNIFKRRLDSHWQEQDIIDLYDFCAQLQGTGSHSEVFRYE